MIGIWTAEAGIVTEMTRRCLMFEHFVVRTEQQQLHDYGTYSGGMMRRRTANKAHTAERTIGYQPCTVTAKLDCSYITETYSHISSYIANT